MNKKSTILEEEYGNDEIVWAKLKGYPYWPS
jgi:hypothetical protein